MPWLSGKSNQKFERLLIRGSSDQVSIWLITDEIVNRVNKNVDKIITYEPNLTHSLSDAWKSMNPTPAGIMDNLVFNLI